VAKPELGLKRQCMNCGAKFYDLNKNPIACPKCGAVYQAVGLSARVAAPAMAARKVRDEDEIENTGDVELVSLDEVEADEEAKDVSTDDDIDIEDDATDDTFLAEEEESEDDVSDLIDGDIEDDEES
jgi:uncharacterized protein (TIGR02300 family)